MRPPTKQAKKDPETTRQNPEEDYLIRRWAEVIAAIAQRAAK